MKLLYIGIIAQVIYWTLLIVLWSSFANASSFRGLNEIKISKKIPCNTGTNGSNCVCPAECLFYVNSTGSCHPINCWNWNSIKSECEQAGKPFVPAIVLQGIPLTGVFGSGFGNIGRWDIFGIYMGVMFGGCVFICCCAIGCAWATNTEDDKSSFVKLGTSCGSCIWAIAVITMWIWGIVVIANKEVDAPYWDWKGDKIMCPLVG